MIIHPLGKTLLTRGLHHFLKFLSRKYSWFSWRCLTNLQRRIKIHYSSFAKLIFSDKYLVQFRLDYRICNKYFLESKKNVHPMLHLFHLWHFSTPILEWKNQSRFITKMILSINHQHTSYRYSSRNRRLSIISQRKSNFQWILL